MILGSPSQSSSREEEEVGNGQSNERRAVLPILGRCDEEQQQATIIIYWRYNWFLLWALAALLSVDSTSVFLDNDKVEEWAQEGTATKYKPQFAHSLTFPRLTHGNLSRNESHDDVQRVLMLMMTQMRDSMDSSCRGSCSGSGRRWDEWMDEWMNYKFGWRVAEWPNLLQCWTREE